MSLLKKIFGIFYSHSTHVPIDATDDASPHQPVVRDKKYWEDLCAPELFKLQYLDMFAIEGIIEHFENLKNRIHDNDAEDFGESTFDDWMEENKNIFYSINSQKEYELATSKLRNWTESSGDYFLKSRMETLDSGFDILTKLRNNFDVFDRKMRNSITISEYGLIQNDKRIEVVRDFLQQMGHNTREYEEQFVLFHYDLEKQHRSSHGFDPQSIPTDGIEFEIWVAENLRKFGWEANQTAASRDQGVDVIAEKNGVRIGIQCKLYAGNVGNTAVQEVLAAKHYYVFHECAVLSNASYTKSAKELALAGGVKLLSHYDIPNFDKLFNINQN